MSCIRVCVRERESVLLCLQVHRPNSQREDPSVKTWPGPWWLTADSAHSLSNSGLVRSVIMILVPLTRKEETCTLKAWSSRFISRSWFPLEKCSSALTVRSLRFCWRARSRAPKAWNRGMVRNMSRQHQQTQPGNKRQSPNSELASNSDQASRPRLNLHWKNNNTQRREGSNWN